MCLIANYFREMKCKNVLFYYFILVKKKKINTKLRVLVIDITRLGCSEKNQVPVGSEKNQGGSKKSHYCWYFYSSSLPSLLVSNSLSTTSSASSFSFSSS